MQLNMTHQVQYTVTVIENPHRESVKSVDNNDTPLPQQLGNYSDNTDALLPSPKHHPQ